MDKPQGSENDITAEPTSSRSELIDAGNKVWGELPVATIMDDLKIVGSDSTFLVMPDNLRQGKLKFWDGSFAALFLDEIHTEHIIRKGEPLALIPREICPIAGNYIYAIPKDWHINLLKRYNEKGTIPKAIVVVKVPLELLASFPLLELLANSTLNELQSGE